MTEPAGSIGTGNLGVVDAIRVPDAVQRAVRRMPVLARVFLALALADALARTLGLLGPAVDLNPSRPLSMLASYVPRDLLIALPAIIVLRFRDAQTATPLVVAGAIVVAVAEILVQPIGSFVTLDYATWALVLLASPAGWLLIGLGLARINPKEPSLRVAGTANLIAALVVLPSVVLALLPLFVPQAVPYGQDPPADVATEIGLLQVLGASAWAYQLRAVVRGFEDRRRPAWARSAGATAATLHAALGLVTAIVTVLARLQLGALHAFTQSDLYVPLFWLGGGGAVGLLVIAFGLGLADPYRRLGGMRLD